MIDVKIRTKKNKTGSESLYLQFSIAGRRYREYINITLVPELCKADKDKNKESLRLAEFIRAEREAELIRSITGETVGNSMVSFYAYADHFVKRNTGIISKSYANSIYKLTNIIQAYKGDNITFKDINKAWLLGYISFLRNEFKARGGKKLAQSSIESYWTIIVVLLNRAVRDGIIAYNPAHKIHIEDRPKRQSKIREYLTIDEIKLLIKNRCDSDDVRRTFLFSCFCGLRYSDIKALKWSHLRSMSDGTIQVEFVQQKTKEPQYAPLSENALMYLPERHGASEDDNIFFMPAPWKIEEILLKWKKRAGITKHVTFHLARHTYATMLLTYGADLYTVSKLLGHKSIKTTEIYAKIVDGKKKEAVNAIPKIE